MWVFAKLRQGHHGSPHAASRHPLPEDEGAHAKTYVTGRPHAARLVTDGRWVGTVAGEVCVLVSGRRRGREQGPARGGVSGQGGSTGRTREGEHGLGDVEGAGAAVDVDRDAAAAFGAQQLLSVGLALLWVRPHRL